MAHPEAQPRGNVLTVEVAGTAHSLKALQDDVHDWLCEAGCTPGLVSLAELDSPDAQLLTVSANREMSVDEWRRLLEVLLVRAGANASWTGSIVSDFAANARTHHH